MAQIEARSDATRLLIGFSKSALGALNLACDHPQAFAAVVLFDAPLMHRELPNWNTADFYTQATWEADLPENRLPEIQALAKQSSLLHVSGENFAQDHEAFESLLVTNEVPHRFLPRPNLPHAWSPDWIQAALNTIPGNEF